MGLVEYDDELRATPVINNVWLEVAVALGDGDCVEEICVDVDIEVTCMCTVS